MDKVISKDGTHIAYSKTGQGPAVVLVDGALCYRSFGPLPQLAECLAPQFTVYTYDRRGRGESGDTQPFSVQREVEDIDALIDAAGGSAFVFGTSSGAALALEAAIKLGSKIKKLAMYEAPYNDDSAALQGMITYKHELQEALATGRPGDGVVLFMKLVGTPGDQVEGMRHAPVWPMFEAVAPTLMYDNAALGGDGAVPAERAKVVTVPTLVMNGGAGAPFMHETVVKLANAIPNAQQRVIDGQTHQVDMQVLAPVLIEFFTN